MIRIPEGSAPNFKNKSWAIGAEVTIPDKGASGVLATIGGRFGGWALLMQDSKRYGYGRVSSDGQSVDAAGEGFARRRHQYVL